MDDTAIQPLLARMRSFLADEVTAVVVEWTRAGPPDAKSS